MIRIEPEGGAPYEFINWETMGWGYWKYPYIPMVDAFKYLDNKHLTHVCNRWAQSKVNDL